MGRRRSQLYVILIFNLYQNYAKQVHLFFTNSVKKIKERKKKVNDELHTLK